MVMSVKVYCYLYHIHLLLGGPQRNSTAQPRAFRGKASFNGGGDLQCIIHSGILVRKKNENGDQGWEKGCDKAESSVSNVGQRI